MYECSMTSLSDVKTAFASVANANIDEIDADGPYAQVAVSDKQTGAFFKTLRTNDFDFDAKRLGDRLVAHIEIEEEEGLGQLFS